MLPGPTCDVTPTRVDEGYFYESDETTLESPIVVSDEPDSSSSRGSYIETYTSDPNYDGPAYQSLPCGKHGASYTPPGWRRVMVKRRKLEFRESK